MKYIIEHLDGKRLYKWCFLEYKHISEIVSKKNLIFTNICSERSQQQLIQFGEVEQKSVTELNLKKVCILDPLAEKVLTYNDKTLFDYFIFGGILGNYPPEKRTKEKLSDKLHCEKRSLGNKQMSTDTAVYVTNKIFEGTSLKDIKFQDEIEIPVAKNVTIELPYRYVIEDEKIVISEELKQFIKKKKGI